VSQLVTFANIASWDMACWGNAIMVIDILVYYSLCHFLPFYLFWLFYGKAYQLLNSTFFCWLRCADTEIRASVDIHSEKIHMDRDEGIYLKRVRVA
jgi:hypothetical protein